VGPTGHLEADGDQLADAIARGFEALFAVAEQYNIPTGQIVNSICDSERSWIRRNL
jgi:hypothetical protein